MEKFIKELLSKGISVSEVTLENGFFIYAISGFYKSGTAKLWLENDQIYAKTRYDTITEIDSFEDLLRLNFKWWEQSRDRFEGWKNPDSAWLPHLLSYDYVVSKTNINYESK